MSDVASSITYAEAGLPLVTLEQGDLLWSYRSSTFQQHKQRCIVLVTCQLQSDSTAGARAREFTDRCVRLASSTILHVLAHSNAITNVARCHAQQGHQACFL